MKNIAFIKSVRALLTAAAVCFAVSCTALESPVDPVDSVDPEPSVSEEGTVYNISASLEQPVVSKMTLDGNDTDGYDLVWADSDAINLVCFKNGFQYKYSFKFTVSSGVGTSNATFTGTIDKEGYSPKYAIFPYSSGSTYDSANPSILYDVPKTQYAVQNNTGKNLNQSVAVVNTKEDGTYDMQFKNIMGMFRVTLSSNTSVKISKIVLHDHAGNMLWGRCRVPILEDESLDYERISLTGGDNTLELKWNTYSTINTTPKSFYFVVPPGALDHGYSIVVYEYDTSKPDNVGKAYTFLQKAGSSKGINRSTILAVNSGAIKDKSEPYDPKERGYYKSLFVDAGTSLNNYCLPEQIPAISELGLENDYEYFRSATYYNLQTDILGVNDGTIGSTHIKYRDDNGVLLYPDCSPRFRAVFVNGGSSKAHGEKLGVEGRRNFHEFFMNGGSYVGACAGAILASTTVDSVNHYDDADDANNYTFGMWPGNVTHTGWPADFGEDGSTSVYTAMNVTDALVAASDGVLFSGMKVEDVRHHGGILIRDNHLALYPEGERLMNYAYSSPNEGGSDIGDAYRFSSSTVDNPVFGGNNWNGYCSTFAYKHVDQATGVDTGRAVLCGSHFENAASGSQLKVFSTMIKYALDGSGAPRMKDDLAFGHTVNMDKSFADGDPGHAMIGDRQYHHFKFTTQTDLYDFNLTLSSEFDTESGIDLYLAMHKGGIAWLSDSEYVLCNKGGNKEFKIKVLPAGTYYVSVFCATGITSTAMDYTSSGATTPSSFYFGYSGHTELMEGVPYSLSMTASSTPGSGTDGGTDEDEDDI